MAPADERYGSRLSREIALERVVNFAQGFGEKHLTLACHAAFPLALTPDLLYQIRANFVPQAPWTAVADVLLSPLCSEVGHELYEMDIAVRNLLLEDLKENHRFGRQRLDNLASFLTEYAVRQLHSDDPETQCLAQTQRWVALAFTQPNELAFELAALLRNSLLQQDRTTQLRITSLANSLAEPLAEYQNLVVYMRSINSLVRGKIEEARKRVETMDPSRATIVEGIQLPSPLSLAYTYGTTSTTSQQHSAGEESSKLLDKYKHTAISIPDRSIPFVNREEALDFIDRSVSEWGTLGVVCIQGPGGVGKSRLLQEVYARYETSSQLLAGPIIDFIDPAFRNIVTIEYNIACDLDERAFKPYFETLESSLSKTEAEIRPPEELGHTSAEFIKCLNELSSNVRILLFFDSIEYLEEDTILDFLVNCVPQLRNVVLLMAGRSLEKFVSSIHSKLDSALSLFDLRVFSSEAAYRYIQMKENRLHISLDPELKEKLSLLSGRLPIQLDLAIEQLAAEVLPAWITELSPEEFLFLSADEMYELRYRFEQWLVWPFTRLRSPMDRLLIMMAHVYPVDRQIIVDMLRLSEEEAITLLERARSLVFVVSLPDGRVRLHDSFRRMINMYVWPAVDPDGDRRRRYSELVTKRLGDTYYGQGPTECLTEEGGLGGLSEEDRVESRYQEAQGFRTSRDHTEPSITFVDREYELKSILSTFTPQYHLVDAPGGYGKTALLQQLERHFKASGWICAYVSIREQETLSAMTRTFARAFQISMSFEDLEDARRMGAALGRSIIRRYQARLGRIEGLAFLVDDVDHAMDYNEEATSLLFSEFIPAFTDVLRIVKPLMESNNIRIVVAGKHIANRISQEGPLSFSVHQLSPFTYPVVLEILRHHYPKTDPAQPTTLAAHMTHYTGGHPGGIARVLDRYEKQASLLIWPVQAYADEIWKTIMRPLSDTILRDISAKYGQILGVLSIFRYLDVGIIRELMDRDLLPTEQTDEYHLIDYLTAMYFMSRKQGRLVIDSQIRQLLALRLLHEDPKTFIEHCYLAKTTYLDKLKNPVIWSPEIWAIEAMFQSLQQCAWEISSPERRAELRDSFYEEVVPQAVQLLVKGRHLQDKQTALQSALEMDEEFRFTVNYFLREDQYSDEPYGRLLRQISFFFEELEEGNN